MLMVVRLVHNPEIHFWRTYRYGFVTFHQVQQKKGDEAVRFCFAPFLYGVETLPDIFFYTVPVRVGIGKT